jgi:hypothetical protein
LGKAIASVAWVGGIGFDRALTHNEKEAMDLNFVAEFQEADSEEHCEFSSASQFNCYLTFMAICAALGNSEQGNMGSVYVKNGRPTGGQYDGSETINKWGVRECSVFLGDCIYVEVRSRR